MLHCLFGHHSPLTDIELGVFATETFGYEPFSPEVTTSSGLPVPFSTSDVVRIEAGKIGIVGAGSCMVPSYRKANSEFFEVVSRQEM